MNAAPNRLPKPPMTTTMNTVARMSKPIWYWITTIGAASTPPRPASAPPSPTASMYTRPTGMPSAVAIRASWRTERSQRP